MITHHDDEKATPAAATPTFESHGGRGFEAYERWFVPAIGAPLAMDLVAAAGLRTGERVLDVACGTGIVARLAAEQVGATGSVAGLDINPGMLAVARAVAPPGAGIGWHEGSADAMPLPNASQDVVLCQMGLQFFRDRPAALREMRRVLAPGGRLLLNVPGPTPPIFAILEEALARHLGPQVARFVDTVFGLHDARALHALIADAGFHAVGVDAARRTLRLPSPAEFLWQYVHSTPLAAAVGGLDRDGHAALQREVVSRWGAFTDGGSLVLDLGISTASAVREG